MLSYSECRSDPSGLRVSILAWIIHECRREAEETDGRRGFSQARTTQAYPER
jgi:hypothetical protein